MVSFSVCFQSETCKNKKRESPSPCFSHDQIHIGEGAGDRMDMRIRSPHSQTAILYRLGLSAYFMDLV